MSKKELRERIRKLLYEGESRDARRNELSPTCGHCGGCYNGLQYNVVYDVGKFRLVSNSCQTSVLVKAEKTDWYYDEFPLEGCNPGWNPQGYSEIILSQLSMKELFSLYTEIVAAAAVSNMKMQELHEIIEKVFQES